jgi:hypothetical protein
MVPPVVIEAYSSQGKAEPKCPREIVRMLVLSGKLKVVVCPYGMMIVEGG